LMIRSSAYRTTITLPIQRVGTINRVDNLLRQSDHLTVAIAPTVRLGSFDTLPVAGTRRGDGGRNGFGVRQGTCASGRCAPLKLHVSRAEVDNANRIALELPSMRLREFSADGDNIAT